MTLLERAIAVATVTLLAIHTRVEAQTVKRELRAARAWLAIELRRDC